MALIPDNGTEMLDDYVANVETSDSETLPSKTYALDFSNGVIGGFIDDDNALKQFIYKALITARSRFLIYTDDYGSELEDLIGDSITPALFESEIKRIVYEALAYDDRIEDVTDITPVQQGDVLTISFTVVKVDGTQFDYSQEVTV